MLPAPLWRIVLCGCIALGAGIGLARMATRPNGPVYQGTLSARIVPVTVDRAGVVIEWHLAEGDVVASGQTLASIADPSVQRRRDQLAEQIARLEADRDRAIAQAELELDWRLKDVQSGIFAARLQSAEYLEERHRHEVEVAALTDLLNRNATAFWSGADSVTDSLVLKESMAQSTRLNTVLRLEAATNATEVCAAQVVLCDEQIESLEELKESLPERVRASVGVDAADRALEEALAQQQVLTAAESRTKISSPAIGRAGVFLKRVGEYAGVGEPIVEILDDSRRFVVVEVPSDRVAEFTLGRELTVVFPGQLRRTGRVIRIAPQAVVREASGGVAAAVVRVDIEQAGLVWPDVPIGARVDASL